MTTNRIDPLSEESIFNILKFDEDIPHRLISRESGKLEYKETFKWSGNRKGKYTKTMASFANSKGGYIFFGIKNKPREVIGLRDSTFDDFDPSTSTSFLNSYFSPEVELEIGTVVVDSMKLGVFYIHEARNKPVICTKNFEGILKEGSIYYRYRARSEVIKYSGLRDILENIRKREQQVWIDTIKKIGKIGVSEVGLLDQNTGIVSSESGSFLISEEVLDKLKFVDEGFISKENGEPTLKVIGEVLPLKKDSISSVKRLTVEKPISIHADNIILKFLQQEKVAYPFMYIESIGYESTGYLPVYFYIYQTKMPISMVIEKIKKIQKRSQGKRILLECLEECKNYETGLLTTGTYAAKRKKYYIEAIRKKTLNKHIADGDLIYFLQAITHLKNKDFEKDYLFKIIEDIFYKIYSKRDLNHDGRIRKAICHLDKIMYFDKCKK